MLRISKILVKVLKMKQGKAMKEHRSARVVTVKIMVTIEGKIIPLMMTTVMTMIEGVSWQGNTMGRARKLRATEELKREELC